MRSWISQGQIVPELVRKPRDKKDVESQVVVISQQEVRGAMCIPSWIHDRKIFSMENWIIIE
jgi:hypothetical protein